MTAPLSTERVEKLSRIVEGMRVAMPAVNSQEVFNDLLAILSSHEKMRAENEGLRQDFEYKNEQLGAALIRAEKAEAELEKMTKAIESWKKDEVIWKETEAKLLAQLAKQAPLIQAVMETDIFQYHDEDTDCPIIREALKLRSEK